MSKVKFLDIELCERTNHYQTFVTIRNKQKVGVHSNNKKKIMLLGMPFRMLMMIMMMVMVIVMMTMMVMMIMMIVMMIIKMVMMMT